MSPWRHPSTASGSELGAERSEVGSVSLPRRWSTASDSELGAERSEVGA
jgi:hypothetical protein